MFGRLPVLTDPTELTYHDPEWTWVQGKGWTYYGDDRANREYGDESDEWFYGRGGNDYFSADDGDDYADGGSGNDTIYGGGGNDTIRGGSGSDKLDGGPGAYDFGYGDSGNDYMTGFAYNYGGSGNDTIKGGRADGGFGNDYIESSKGFGNDGNDTLIGYEDRDNKLRGGDGDDLIQGGLDGYNTLEGGRGNDLVFGKDDEDRLCAGGYSEATTDNSRSLYVGGSDHDVFIGGYGRNHFLGSAVSDANAAADLHDDWANGRISQSQLYAGLRQIKTNDTSFHPNAPANDGFKANNADLFFTTSGDTVQSGDGSTFIRFDSNGRIENKPSEVDDPGESWVVSRDSLVDTFGEDGVYDGMCYVVEEFSDFIDSTDQWLNAAFQILEDTFLQ